MAYEEFDALQALWQRRLWRRCRLCCSAYASALSGRLPCLVQLQIVSGCAEPAQAPEHLQGSHSLFTVPQPGTHA